jgi:predicted naringenin-chalcone synthase
MIPSLDAHLINLMGFRSNVRRMPFTELGWAAGAMALGRAADFLKISRQKHPTATVFFMIESPVGMGTGQTLRPRRILPRHW